MSSQYTWFIDPKGDERSNALVAQMLGSDADESECYERVCSDDVARQLWKCPDHRFVAQFEGMARRCRYRFDIYRRKGRHGKISEWSFGQGQPNHPVTRGNGHSPVSVIEEEASELMGVAKEPLPF